MVLRFLSTAGLVGIIAAALILPATASAGKRKCPKLKASTPFVYAIGSSTLGSYLGSYLKRDLPKAVFKFRKWAKASSGLARPDFHDWLGKLPDIAKQWDPDVFIVSLGTNDFQRIRKGKRWIKIGTPAWKAEYTARVDKLLETAAGPRKKRVIIWVGPGVFNQPRARKMSLLVNTIVKERLAAFKGHAFHVDIRAQVVGKRGRPVKTLRVPGKRAKINVYEPDRIHMTRDAMYHLLAKPILRALKACKQGRAVASQ